MERLTKCARALCIALLAAEALWGLLFAFGPVTGQNRVFCCQGRIWFEDYRMPRECAAAIEAYRPDNVDRKDACYAPIAYDLAKCFPRDHHVGGPVFASFAAVLMAMAVFLLAKRRSPPGRGAFLPFVLTAVTLFAAPTLFAFGTGNQLPLAIAGICLFFAWKDAPGWRRAVALAALSAAIALKLVPVFLAFTLVVERRWRDFLAVAFLSAALLFVPFLWYGGFPAFRDFLECLRIRGDYYGIRETWGFVGLDRCLRLGLGLPVESTRETFWLSRSLNVLFSLACLTSCALRCWRDRDARRMDSTALLLLTVAMIVLPGASVIYNSLFLVPAFLARLAPAEPDGGSLSSCEALAWFALFCPLQIPFSFSSANVPLAALSMLVLGFCVLCRSR